jgi:hypothetical protein
VTELGDGAIVGVYVRASGTSADVFAIRREGGRSWTEDTLGTALAAVRALRLPVLDFDDRVVARVAGVAPRPGTFSSDEQVGGVSRFLRGKKSVKLSTGTDGMRSAKENQNRNRL